MPRPQRRLPLLAALAACAIAVIAPAPASAQACGNSQADPTIESALVIRDATLCLLNAQRAQQGLRSLAPNRRLALAAKRHAQDMVARDYFSHDSLDGRDFVTRIVRASYVRRGDGGWTLGENLAWGSYELATPSAIVDAWMNSPGHRANILNGRFREIGFGLAVGAPIPDDAAAATYATEFGTRR